MNIYQRIVLVAGAAPLIIAIWTSPKMVITQEGRFNPAMVKAVEPLAKITEINSVIARSIGVVGATLFVFFSLKDIVKKEK